MLGHPIASHFAGAEVEQAFLGVFVLSVPFGNFELETSLTPFLGYMRDDKEVQGLTTVLFNVYFNTRVFVKCLSLLLKIC